MFCVQEQFSEEHGGFFSVEELCRQGQVVIYRLRRSAPALAAAAAPAAAARAREAALAEAAGSGDIARLKRLLAGGAAADERDNLAVISDG